MNLIPLKTRLILPNDNLIELIDETLSDYKEKLHSGDILAIASKAISYSQNRLVKSNDIESLVDQESNKTYGKGKMRMTLKNKILIPNAGLDSSNAPEEYMILWPENPFEIAEQLKKDLMTKYKLETLGILITDSFCQPLRKGTTGVAIGWAGFEGVKDERETTDLFGQKMEYTQMAVADNLASAANLLMGETDQSTPLVIIENVKVEWTDKKASEADYWMEPEQCIFKDFQHPGKND